MGFIMIIYSPQKNLVRPRPRPAGYISSYTTSFFQCFATQNHIVMRYNAFCIGTKKPTICGYKKCPPKKMTGNGAR